jgi:uncharacterized protein (TIGR01777 family)
MSTFEQRSPITASAQELLAWHLRPGAFERLVPPWDGTRVISRSGNIEDNTMRVELSAALPGGLRQRWKLHHENFSPDGAFDDVLDSGLFPYWRHEHRMHNTGEGLSELSDRIEYRIPFGPLGKAGGGRQVRKHLERMFTWRHSVTQGDIAAHARAAMPPMRIAISGATGLVGRALAAYLATAGHTVVPISRSSLANIPAGEPLSMAPAVVWDPAAGTIDADALAGVDAVVHLAGEPIAKDQWVPPARWSAESKRRIRESRVQGTDLLARTLAAMDTPPKVLVSASAIGIYGDRGDELLTEHVEPGTGFLSDVAREWEAATAPAEAAGIRVVHARLGIVLSPDGGALKRLLLPTKLGAGGPLGSGKQWWSWVALDDVLGAIEYAIARDTISGPMNVVAPHALRQKEFARVAGRVLRRPSFAPAPAFVLKAMLGAELAQELLLASTHVIPDVLTTTGYTFRYPNAEGALRHLLGRGDTVPATPHSAQTTPPEPVQS